MVHQTSTAKTDVKERYETEKTIVAENAPRQKARSTARVACPITHCSRGIEEREQVERSAYQNAAEIRTALHIADVALNVSIAEAKSMTNDAQTRTNLKMEKIPQKEVKVTRT